jgi:hypothetical protein
MGNSDSTSPRFTSLEVFATDSAGKLWKSFMSAYTSRGWGKNNGPLPVADFERPEGVVQATIDGYTGGSPGRWTRTRTREWFIRGTEPGSRGEVDEPGLLYDKRCGGWLVDLTNVGEPSSWSRYIRGYMNRAKSSRGGVMAPSGGGCPVKATPKPRASEEPGDPEATPAPDEGGEPDDED